MSLIETMENAYVSLKTTTDELYLKGKNPHY